MFQIFEYYSKDNNKISELQIYEKLCLVVLNDELNDFYTLKYNFELIKEIASTYKIKEIKNYNNYIKLTGFNFIFDNNGNLVELIRYRFENNYIRKIFNNNTKKLYINDFLVPYLDSSVNYIFDNEEINNNVKQLLINTIFTHINDKNYIDINNNDYDFDMIKNTFINNNITKMSLTCNNLRHGYSLSLKNNVFEITRFHSDYLVYYKKFIDNNLVEYKKYNGLLPIIDVKLQDIKIKTITINDL